MNKVLGFIEEYEVINSFQIGEKTIAIGECTTATKGHRYICGYTDDLDESILFVEDKPFLSDNYLKTLKIYTELMNKEILKMDIEIKFLDVPCSVITADDCYDNDFTKNITGKIVAIDRDVFKPEYQRADVQICIVTGGVGAEAYAKGKKVKCINLYSGVEVTYGREDILGEIKPERMPDWVNNYLLILQPDDRVFEYNNRHYLFFRELTREEHEDLTDVVVMDVTDKKYDYHKFLAKAGRDKTGLFLCLENNDIYLPYKKFLSIWMGERYAN